MTALAWEVHMPAGIRVEDLDLTAKANLPSAWVRVWASTPSAPTLFDRDRGWIHAEQLEEATRRMAGRLQGAGLEPGDRMLFSAASSLELVIAHVAALRAGIVVVGPDVDLPDGEPAALDAMAPDEPALIGYTSGTTGSPKGAVLTHANLLAGSESVGLAWRWTARDRLVLALPLFHVHGLCVRLHGTLLAGASTVLLPRFDVDSVLDAAGSHDASLFFGVPTMYHRLAQSSRVGELARLRLCVSGSAPLPAELHRALAERGGQEVLERYGMTETLMDVSHPYH